MKTLESQSDSILAFLKDGGTLTAIQALRQFGCFRLAARMYDLKNMGWRVSREMVNVNGYRYAKYSLPKP